VYANYDGGKAAGTLSEAEEKLGGIPCTFISHTFTVYITNVALSSTF
jgi:hypothetical protein